MLYLVDALPDFSDELSRGLADLGHQELATSVKAIVIVERCKCNETGCITFYAVPKSSLTNKCRCKTAYPVVRGLTCVQYIGQNIVWVEAVGRPDDRKKLERYGSQFATE